jgi:DNA-binding MarR family transcriptional regulator
MQLRGRESNASRATNPTSQNGDEGNLRVLVRKLETFINQIRILDDGMPVQTLACFLAIARREGQSIVELSVALGIAQSSASRNVSALSQWNWKKKPGLDLVETVIDLMERRRKQVLLNAKGRRLLEQIQHMMKVG